MKIQTTHSIVSLVALTLLAIPAANVAQAAPGSQRAVQEFAIQQGVGTAFAQSWQPAAIKSIFERSKITAVDGALLDYFGNSVCLSGNLALIGAPNDGDNGVDSGSAYIFAFDGTSWTEQAKLIASDGAAFDAFGGAVAISGNIALVGAYANNEIGAVYVFAFDGTTWTQQAKLTAPDGEDAAYFGYSVSLSGNLALVGAYGKNAAYIFAFDGATWTQQARLTTTDGAARFGYSVSLSGNIALVGATGTNDTGAAYVFAFDGTTWNQEARLTALDAAKADAFGTSVSLLGGRALVGASGKNTNTGAAYVFAFDGSTWTQQFKLTAPNARRNDYFGAAVALTPTRAVVGASQVYPNPGLAYVFSSSGDQWKREARLVPSDGGVYDEFGRSISISGRNVLIGAVKADSANSVNTGAAYFFSLPRQP